MFINLNTKFKAHLKNIWKIFEKHLKHISYLICIPKINMYLLTYFCCQDAGGFKLPDSYILQSACGISMKGICSQKKITFLIIFVHKSCQWYLFLKISGLVSLRCCEYSMIVKAACHAWRPLIILHLIWPVWYLFWKDAHCNITKVMQALYLKWKDIPLKTCW